MIETLLNQQKVINDVINNIKDDRHKAEIRRLKREVARWKTQAEVMEQQLIFYRNRNENQTPKD